MTMFRLIVKIFSVSSLLLLVSLKDASAALPPNFDEKLVKSLSLLTDFVFLPDGQMLISEKNGKIHVMENPLSLDSGIRTVMNLEGVICNNGERGVNSMLVDPNFNSNRYVYVYYTWNKNNFCGTDSDQAPVNRLSRFTLANDFSFGSEKHLVQTDPVVKQYHNAGGIVWGNDGNIWLVTGDGGEREHNFYTAAGQRPDNLRAKLIRITPSGGIPSDNPFRGSNSARCNDTGMTSEGKECQEIYALGLRNPWSMSSDPYVTDKVRLLINDVGGSAWEEVNEAGSDHRAANYGFPVREGPCKLAKTTDCDNQDAEFTSPYYYYIHRTNPDPEKKDEGAGTAGDFLPPNSGWPAEFNGSYFYADFVFNEIYRLVENGGSDCKSCNPPTSRFDAVPFFQVPRITRIHFGPDDNGKKAMYYISHGGDGFSPGIRKIFYAGSANRVPVAKIDANPTFGALPLTVTFDGSSSTDPDGDSLSYEWDLNGNGNVDSTSSSTTFTFENAGMYTGTLTVKDGNGGTSTQTIRIDAGNVPPVPRITMPLDDTLFSVGDVLTLVGSATDEQEGALPDSALEWYVDKYHADHTHPYLAWTSGNNIAIDPAPIPEDFMAATNSFLRIYLKVADSTGLSATVTRDIYPNKVTMDFTSEPSGMTLILDGYEVTTPYTGVSWDKHTLKLEAPDQGLMVFDSWSDAADRVHNIPVGGDVGSSFRAIFRELQLNTILTSASSGITSEDGPVAIDGLNGLTIEQLSNGKLMIMNTINSSMIWESNPSSVTESTYRTFLQSDGNFITRRTTDDAVVWKSQSEGGKVDSSCGSAFLAIEATAQILGVYCGAEDNSSGSLWSIETGPVLAATGAPTLATPTMEPTIETSLPTRMPTGVGADPTAAPAVPMEPTTDVADPTAAPAAPMEPTTDGADNPTTAPAAPMEPTTDEVDDPTAAPAAPTGSGSDRGIDDSAATSGVPTFFFVSMIVLFGIVAAL
ncbi:unnamed protein product [Cylindrotheca closterium]|uniref:PKD domain-containing protein n=1 Tax=Cylindrotheca closterium TaxID=2856 RepID=A0AAD2G8F3_9STRA|nr:unnamed protein product [Cylindrotheca closterium]